MSPLNALPYCSNGQRIGLLGGSFNPAHAGHLQLSLLAMKHLKLDAVWWLVTPQNPLKSSYELKPLAVRAEFAALLSHHPRIKVTTIEEVLNTRFTIDTLTKITKLKPHVTFVWLMGADNFATFHLWKKWREIGALMPLCVVNRPSYGFKALNSKAARRFKNYTFISTLNNPISSTAIRRLENL